MTIRGLGDRWLAGDAVPGVAFAHNQGVEVLTGARAQARGTIALLLRIEPEPVYLVALSDGRGDVRMRQSELRALP